MKYLFSLNDYRSVKLLLLTLIWTLFIIIWQEHDHGYVYLTSSPLQTTGYCKLLFWMLCFLNSECRQCTETGHHAGQEAT